MDPDPDYWPGETAPRWLDRVADMPRVSRVVLYSTILFHIVVYCTVL